jgi:hypothetical protein
VTIGGGYEGGDRGYNNAGVRWKLWRNDNIHIHKKYSLKIIIGTHTCCVLP